MKLRFFSILIIAAIILAIFGRGENPKDHLVEIYTLALDSIMEKDKALNSEMEFIAIDMSNFDRVDKDQKKAIMRYFNDKYKVEVMDATMDDLKKNGYYNPDEMSLDGILLRIKKVHFKFNHNAVFEVSKFKSGKGAIGVECTVHHENGEWKIKNSKVTWIS